MHYITLILYLISHIVLALPMKRHRDPSLQLDLNNHRHHRHIADTELWEGSTALDTPVDAVFGGESRRSSISTQATYISGTTDITDISNPTGPQAHAVRRLIVLQESRKRQAAAFRRDQALTETIDRIPRAGRRQCSSRDSTAHHHTRSQERTSGTKPATMRRPVRGSSSSAPSRYRNIAETEQQQLLHSSAGRDQQSEHTPSRRCNPNHKLLPQTNAQEQSRMHHSPPVPTSSSTHSQAYRSASITPRECGVLPKINERTTTLADSSGISTLCQNNMRYGSQPASGASSPAPSLRGVLRTNTKSKDPDSKYTVRLHCDTIDAIRVGSAKHRKHVTFAQSLGSSDSEEEMNSVRNLVGDARYEEAGPQRQHSLIARAYQAHPLGEGKLRGTRTQRWRARLRSWKDRLFPR